MSKNHRKNSAIKNPNASTRPNEDKIPRSKAGLDHTCRPDFRTEQMDLDGPWNWNALHALHLRDLLQKILHSQQLTWQELGQHGSHLIDIDDIVTPAQKRLAEIHKDDVDHLYSLRLTGEERVWGIKQGNILWLLWWDPSHAVCPCHKKHT